MVGWWDMQADSDYLYLCLQVFVSFSFSSINICLTPVAEIVKAWLEWIKYDINVRIVDLRGCWRIPENPNSLSFPSNRKADEKE